MHITGKIKQHKSTKMVSHSALQNICLHTATANTSFAYMTRSPCWSELWLSKVGEGGVQSTLFCIFNHCYFNSSPNKLKICHTIKQFYIDNIMPKHENNALQKNFYNQFEKDVECVKCAPCLGHTRHEHGVHLTVNRKLGCMYCIMFTW